MNIENPDMKKKELRTSKGYRLKLSTHNLIKSLQELTSNDADTVITESLLLMYKKVLAEKESNIKTNIIS
ncbi:MAG TPA: hypothetical protein VG961_02745 [Ignavibacteria bacterium]|nr:hypothetical protein [Ignavibacteria bacterium]